MGKKGSGKAKASLKATLLSQQSRLKHKQKVVEASQVAELKGKKKPKTPPTAAIATVAKGKGKATTPATRRPTIPFGCSDRILLVGEGNFSFARALFDNPPKDLQFLPVPNVTATAYDSEEECYSKYSDAQQNVAYLRDKGMEVLFGVDATRLERTSTLKGRTWDKIVWNFPHAGKGITDQDRNILSNQRLILDFLRSASHSLCRGPPPVALPSRPKKRQFSNDEEKDKEAQEIDSEEDEPLQTSKVKSRGTVLITLRNQVPYTLWDIPRLAKHPPAPVSSSAKPTPPYLILRSFAFHRELWHGYEHRMTKGERPRGTGQGGEDRTWEFYLKDAEEPS